MDDSQLVTLLAVAWIIRKVLTSSANFCASEAEGGLPLNLNLPRDFDSVKRDSDFLRRLSDHRCSGFEYCLFRHLTG